MKILIPIDGDNLDSNINNTFGRCKQFIMVNLNSNEFNLIDNEQNLQAAQGAGIQSAQNIIKSGADTVITLNCGPKAYKVLSGSGVQVYIAKKGTVQENIDAYKNNELKSMDDATVEGHWV